MIAGDPRHRINFPDRFDGDGSLFVRTEMLFHMLVLYNAQGELRAQHYLFSADQSTTTAQGGGMTASLEGIVKVC